MGEATWGTAEHDHLQQERPLRADRRGTHGLRKVRLLFRFLSRSGLLFGDVVLLSTRIEFNLPLFAAGEGALIYRTHGLILFEEHNLTPLT